MSLTLLFYFQPGNPQAECFTIERASNRTVRYDWLAQYTIRKVLTEGFTQQALIGLGLYIMKDPTMGI